MMKSCMEIVSYRLKAGVSEETYMKYVNKLQGAIVNQEGFIKREVYHDQNSGVWFEMVEWESAEIAKQSGEKIMQEPSMIEGMALIDESTIQLHYVKQLM